MAANLDFVESVFGNGGDPADPANDAGLDVRHWTGHTGGIFLAPHLIELKKKDLGLPHLSEATERQVRDGMCTTAANSVAIFVMFEPLLHAPNSQENRKYSAVTQTEPTISKPYAHT